MLIIYNLFLKHASDRNRKSSIRYVKGLSSTQWRTFSRYQVCSHL